VKVKRVTVLISGSGSNLQALIDATSSGRLDVEICHVISNRADAPGLQRAHKAQIPTSVLPHEQFSKRSEFDQALAALAAFGKPQLLVLAGFMRILGAPMLQLFAGRIINLHPSLLPLYPGTGTYQRAIEAGDKEHGASIHFVTAELDGGPVISQVHIPILPGDNADILASRLSPREHDLVVSTVELFSHHRVHCANDAVFLDGKPFSKPLRLQADGTLTDQD